MKRALETDQALWIVFVVAVVVSIVLDRVAGQIMATWGWILILIALGAGLVALAWPLFSEKTSAEPGAPQPLAPGPGVQATDPFPLQEEASTTVPPTGVEANTDTL